MRVGFYEPSRAYEAQREELDAAFRRVMSSERIILGPEVESFEREFAELTGKRHAVGVASGTDAVELALRALELPPGSEVICPNLTAVATATAIARAGHRPVLVDVDPATLVVDVEAAQDAVTPDTAAIVAVHLYGRPAPVAELLELGLPVVDDAAQAHGLELEGTIAAYSFYPTKNLGAFGDGGAVATSDEGLAESVRELRSYGHQAQPGVNSRLDELQAALLRVRLRRFEEDNRRRAEIAARYDDAFGRTSPTGVHHLYVIRTEQRDDVRAELLEAGVETGVHYPRTIAEQPAFAAARVGNVPVSTAAAREVLSLPCYPHLTDEEVEHVVSAVGTARTLRPSA